MRALRLVFVLLVLSATPAFASVVSGLSIEQMVGRADCVVQGTVLSASANWTPDHRRILTQVRVRVDEPLAGTPEKEITIVIPGGTVGELAQMVVGGPTFSVGEQTVVFLRRRSPAVYGVLELSHGKFTLQENMALRATGGLARQASQAALEDRLKVSELKSRIQRARGAPGHP